MLARFAGSLALLRPRALAKTRKSVEVLTGDARDTRRALKQLAAGQAQLQAASHDVIARLEKDVAQPLAAVAREVRALQQQVSTLTLRESQLRAVIRADAALEHALPDAAVACDETRLAPHVRAAVERAALRVDPFPFAVIEDLFPSSFYEALVRGIPPVELFGDRPFNKQQLTVPFDVAPAYSRQVWHFFVSRVARTILQPLLLEKFRQPLEQWIASNWPALAADPFGPPVEFTTADGRIMLRGRGYCIPPHRDPKWGFLTCLLYLARKHDSDRWGTQLYSVSDDPPAKGAAPHWIDSDRCRLAADVPFRRNSMLVFLNSNGAHGAHIPEDAEPADLQRYIYQCRVGPTPGAMRALLAMLPEERVPLWAGKIADY
jgi:hypothetical protein